MCVETGQVESDLATLASSVDSQMSLTDSQIAKLRPLLSRHARASQDASGSFRPPQVGIVEAVASGHHHFIVGRRGTGKSMLLRNVQIGAHDSGKSATSSTWNR